MLKSLLTGAHRWGAPLALLLALAPSPAPAQVAETPGAALSRHIRILASNPRDFNALIGAGRSALELGDLQAAAGFFGRAEELNPRAPAAKAGLGAAMVQTGDPRGGMAYFEQAERLGAPAASMALDRGMAHDLLGDPQAAQADYRVALSGPSGDEARRRLALSLAISRDRKGAIDAIQPLLNRRDPAAQRARAFVLALTGDRAGAGEAIEAVMPGAAARFEPFFHYLPNLSNAEKAAAVHLGIFPDDAATRVAQAEPRTSPARPQAVPPKPPAKVAEREPAAAAPPPAPSFNLPSAMAAATPPPAAPSAAPGPAFTITESEGRLTGIDKLLATVPETSSAPASKAEGPTAAERAAAARAARDAKAAAAKKAAEKKVREEKLAAEKKAREEAARLGVAGTHWVQLAGGANQDRMAAEHRKLSAKAGKLLKSRPAYVSAGKDYFRLLVGPFDSKGAAQAFVNKLAKEGVDGFSWTRTPAQIKIEKLPSR